MKIYLIVRNDDWSYDDYDSAVVVAESPEQAVQFLKAEHGTDGLCSWGKYDVTVTEIIPTTPKIIIESFNAG
jgi:hypothetical protein